MGKKILLGVVLAVEAVLCVLFSLVWRGQQDINVFKIIEKPFELIGDGLRHLSLLSSTGNTVAIIIYCAVCFIPVAIALCILIKKKAKWEELLLLLLSALMFWGIYIFINPTKIASMGGVIIGASVYKIEIVTTILSVIVSYLTIKFVRAFEKMKEPGLVKALKVICVVALMVIVVLVCFGGFTSLLENMQKVADNNQYIKNTYAILILRFIVEQLPNVCLFIIISHLMTLTGLVRKGFINQDVLASVDKLSAICKKSIVVILVSIMLINIIQIAVSGHISLANYNVTIPVFEILGIVVLLIITKVIAESNKIKEVNDLFI